MNDRLVLFFLKSFVTNCIVSNEFIHQDYNATSWQKYYIMRRRN